MTHISKIDDKSARNLAQAEMPVEPYHNDIKRAAQILVEEGNDEFVYIGSDSAVIFKFPIRNGAVRTFAFNAWNKHQRHLEVSSEYDVNPDPGPPSVFDGFGQNELNPIEMDKIRRYERQKAETPIGYAERTGDTSRLSDDEMERYWERHAERLSGYR